MTKPRWPRFVRRMWRTVNPRPVDPTRPSFVQRGDEARAQQDWRAAAAAYRSAVEIEPTLGPIWIQLGHALKEQAEFPAALEAYGAASALQPELAEPHVYMAHICKQLGRTEAAIVHFIRALHAGEQSRAQSEELLRLLAQHGDIGRTGITKLLRRTLAPLPPGPNEAALLGQIRRIINEDMAAPPPLASADTRPALVFDISDLISYYANARLPTGIQRVQIETIEGAVARAGEREIRLCCFIEGREEWLELPLARMRAIARLSTAGGDRFEPAWIEAVEGLRLYLSLTEPFEFPQGASLINLGTSWWLQNYFLFVRRAKR